VLGYRKKKNMFGYPAGAGGFSLLEIVQTGCKAHKVCNAVSTGNSFLGDVKWSDREAGHLPPSDAEFKDEWSYTFSCL